MLVGSDMNSHQPKHPIKYNDLVMVLELAGQGNLVQRLARRCGRLDEGEAVALVLVPLLGALAHLHRQGVVHRDIKPGGWQQGIWGCMGDVPALH